MRIASRVPVLVLVLLPSLGFALERGPVIRSAHMPPAPAAAATCEITYFDDCTQFWLTWPLEDAGDTFGVAFQSCAPNAELDGVWIWQQESVPSGWGFTGYISVYDADEEDSPLGPPLARQPYVQGDQWTYWPFSVAVPERFVVTIEYVGGGSGGLLPITDYAPQSPCIGYRPEPHSYYYGTVDNPLRPGSPLFDPNYGAYELSWHASLSVPTKIPRDSWSAIKSLYR